jgi:hypothetical protein
MSSVTGYNIKEEVKEIGSDISKSRNDIVIGILSFLGGTIIANSLTDKSVMDRIKSFVGYDDEDEDEDE